MTDVRTWRIEPLQEFRFEVDAKHKILVNITLGRAELFGTELASNHEYSFTSRKLAIFTYHGCVIETSGLNAVEYIGFETSMQYHLNIHFALQTMRSRARESGIIGPRVMVVGPADVGKTVLAKTLANYAARCQTSTILCDIDPSGGMISLPGTLSAFVLHRSIDVEEEFNAPVALYKTTPLSLYYGSPDLHDKIYFYKSLVSKLASYVSKRLCEKDLKHSGIIVDTPSHFMGKDGLDIMNDAVVAFDINVIIVIGNERFLSDLQRKYPDADRMTILKVPKSGGVVSREVTTKKEMSVRRIKEYFYGTLNHVLTPFSQTVSFSDLVVRRVIQGSVAPLSTLPIGMEANPDEFKFVKVEVGGILLHSVLAISFAKLPGTEELIGDQKIHKSYTLAEEAELLLSKNIMGFVYVSQVDEAKRRMTILTPNTGRLPRTYLIMGALKWLDV